MAGYIVGVSGATYARASSQAAAEAIFQLALSEGHVMVAA